MELLGQSVSDLQPDGTKIAPKTVVSVVLQTMSALQHIHRVGIMHRDIKQGNLMRSLGDPSKIKLIDFGISRMFYEDEPKRRDPGTKGYKMVGTLDWASMNAHDGIALSARDDFESLAYVALELLRGDLPWGYRPWLEPRRIAQEEVRASKHSHTAESLGAGFPPEFSSLLTYSRSLRFNQLPDYNHLTTQFTVLGQTLGLRPDSALDWSPQPSSRPPREIMRYSGPDEDPDDDEGTYREPSLSYMAPDYELWDTQHTERDSDLTLPIDVAKRMDRLIPTIADVQPRWF